MTLTRLFDLSLCGRDANLAAYTLRQPRQYGMESRSRASASVTSSGWISAATRGKELPE